MNQRMASHPEAPMVSDDWNNSGGDAGRNGLSRATGPGESDPIWIGGRSSLIAWQPVTEGHRVFMVRQQKWPYNQPHDAYVVAMNLQTGEELMAVEIPYEDGDWTPWIAGVKNGRVFVSRSGNGATVSAVLYALSSSDGSILWTSADEIDAGPYDGVVFTPGGDPVIASFQDIWRIRAEDGHTVWHAPRTGSVSGSCGGALFGGSFYVADVTGGGHIIVRYDLASGDRLYESPVMEGFLMQNTPMVDRSGRIYLARVQNNALVDYFYSFTDTGSGFVKNWRVPAAYSTSSEFGVGPDGSVYMMTPGPCLARLDPETGNVLDETDPLTGFSKPRMAVDSEGRVFFSNGAFATGLFTVYDAALNSLWETGVTNINIGGPAIGLGGVLVVCGVGTDVRAFQGPAPAIARGFERFGRSSSADRAPNPFRGLSRSCFTPEEFEPVSMEIFDPKGRLVRVLVEAGDDLGAGMERLDWNGCDAKGCRVREGVYLIHNNRGDRTEFRKVRLLW